MKNRNLMSKIIPPATRDGRENFDGNQHIIKRLNNEEKKFVEKELIKLFQNNYRDLLVIETMASLNSLECIVEFKHKIEELNNEDNNFIKMILASYIYMYDNTNEKMKTLIINLFKEIEKHDLYTGFYYLAKIEDKDIRAKIKEFYDDSEFLLSYHSKNAIKINGN